MKFICDVHISFKLVKHLNALGFETFHVNDLLHKWHSKDDEICAYADLHDLIVITKDYDFKNSFFVKRTPRKVIKVSLGNISNERLIKIITENLEEINRLNAERNFLMEIDKDFITFSQH